MLAICMESNEGDRRMEEEDEDKKRQKEKKKNLRPAPSYFFAFLIYDVNVINKEMKRLISEFLIISEIEK